MQSFFIALQFLTRLPVPQVTWNNYSVAKSLKYYPIVGLIIGMILLGIAGLSNHTNPMLQAALILGTWVIITGALHLDGLADCTDAWIGGLGDRERTLAIMKDPYCGPMGVISLVVVLLIQYSAIVTLTDSQQTIALLYIPIIARLLPSLFFLTTAYVRKEGLGSAFADNNQRTTLISMLVIGSILTILFSGAMGLLLLSVAVATFFIVRISSVKRIGGFTGDVLGTSIVIFETSALLVIALFY